MSVTGTNYYYSTVGYSKLLSGAQWGGGWEVSTAISCYKSGLLYSHQDTTNYIVYNVGITEEKGKRGKGGEEWYKGHIKITKKEKDEWYSQLYTEHNHYSTWCYSRYMWIQAVLGNWSRKSAPWNISIASMMKCSVSIVLCYCWLSVFHLLFGPTNHLHSRTIRSQELQPQHFSGGGCLNTLNYSGSTIRQFSWMSQKYTSSSNVVWNFLIAPFHPLLLLTTWFSCRPVRVRPLLEESSLCSKQH